jgi:hypothetical protein
MQEEIHLLDHFYLQGSKDTEVLEKNVNDYPYSSLADVLLLYHYKKTDHPGFEELAKKTVLHFKNAHWLQFLLEQTLQETPAIIEHTSSNELKEISQTETYPDDEKSPEEFPHAEEVAQSLTNENIISDTEEVNTDILHEEKFETTEFNERRNETVPEVLHEENFQKEIIDTDETKESPPDEIAFEPLHTVDYFASQGIKLTDEPVTNDKLGNQMKSFTAWLKSMKKLHPSKLEEQNLATEQVIQNSAEESNINTEVLTEAMAEVLIKQNKKEKAIEMFSKLSLINPSKSAYFAAKIESIKSS